MIRGRCRRPIWDGALLRRLYLTPQKNVEHNGKCREQKNMNHSFARATAFSLILTAALARAAQPADEVTHTVRAEMERQHIPGLALLVSRNGLPVRAQGFGLANVELNVPVSAKTIFQSGSMGKQFTATAVMLLVEEGKISLDDPLRKYFADGPGWWSEVTIRELLSHTAGFTDYPKDFDLRKDYSEEELLKMVEAIPAAYPPGTDWAYSNLGYVTLGILIHRVSGQYFGDFLQGRVFKPLGMSTTRIVSEADIIPNRAAGYRLENGQIKNQEWVAQSANSTADGSLYFTILDLVKWDAALYTDKILNDSRRQEMWTVATLRDGKPNRANYGFGWFVESQKGRRVLEHGGRWQGFSTQISRYVDDRLTVVVLTNQGNCDPHLIADKVAAIYFGTQSRSK
jgi:CubicO group peptidase (beta-lactamase class C family)